MSDEKTIPALGEEEQDGDGRLYYGISEVAEMVGVSNSLIRFWEKEFQIIKPKKNRNGNRLFTGKDIENLKFIYHLVKEKGHTLAGAKKIIKNSKYAAKKNYEMIENLKELKTFLVSLRQRLDG